MFLALMAFMNVLQHLLPHLPVNYDSLSVSNKARFDGVHFPVQPELLKICQQVVFVTWETFSNVKGKAIELLILLCTLLNSFQGGGKTLLGIHTH